MHFNKEEALSLFYASVFVVVAAKVVVSMPHFQSHMENERDCHNQRILKDEALIPSSSLYVYKPFKAR
jgi:hypothetical protein